jgi:hypothetical protein
MFYRLSDMSDCTLAAMDEINDDDQSRQLGRHSDGLQATRPSFDSWHCKISSVLQSV